MEREIWIAACAHRLQRQWRTVDPDVLEEVAGDLWNDETLRNLRPEQAATALLEPVALRYVQPLHCRAQTGVLP